jgi:hypothetical protein
MTETEERMSRLEIGGVWIISPSALAAFESEWNAACSGQIIMVPADDAVRVSQSQKDEALLGCIAGWVSED